VTYRAKEAFIAIRDNPPGPFTFVAIHPGSIITVKGEVLQSGLVDVWYDGQIVAAFMRDIEARADMVQSVANRSQPILGPETHY
jgi:hypothetical protein